jgi:hypothetical protein
MVLRFWVTSAAFAAFYDVGIGKLRSLITQRNER